MLEIQTITIENLQKNVTTDNPTPRISFILESDQNNVYCESYEISVTSQGEEFWKSGKVMTRQSLYIPYGGKPLNPFSDYTVTVIAYAKGESARKQAQFSTGRLSTPWRGQWITDLSLLVDDVISPPPITFLKKFPVKGAIRRAKIYSTAYGIYELQLNGRRVGEDYLAPGFTSYKHYLQYQSYDITEMLQTDNILYAVVGGGWAVGFFHLQKKTKSAADRQALLAEIHIEYQDGSTEIISTDSSWKVSLKSRAYFADIYNGEKYDARIRLEELEYKSADITSPRVESNKKPPQIIATYGVLTKVKEELSPVTSYSSKFGGTIYDFGQNFAGVLNMKINGKDGQIIRVKHAEITLDDEIYTANLRTADAMLEYICMEGKQEYSPTLTYMGFRYVKVDGITPENIAISAKVLYSDMDIIGDFECSNPDINQLHHNIVWSGKSNFVDIPTDCPQRDERVGWTGDIAVFASTACFLFDTRRFFDKWLLDLKAEQGKGGGLPFIIPTGGKGRHVFASPGWGDASYMVTWADYLAFGDKDLLARQYESMKKYINAAKRWSNMLSIGHKRYIWSKMFTFGDWLSPDGDSKTWVLRGKWLGTAYLANGCQIVAETAKILHKDEEASYYLALKERIVNAYRKVFTNGKGKLKKEFQSAYVCPLYFHMFEGEEHLKMAKYLNDDVVKRGNKLATGFMGTPFLLFALSDNGYVDTAYHLLFQEECPSWLYAVKSGATTIWERWDALRPDGTVNLAPVDPRKKEKKSKGGNEKKEMDSMVSFNHFSYGSVGDWLYRRVAGIEVMEAGYKTFRIKPMVGGGLTYARGSIDTGYGKIISSWKKQDGVFTIDVTVPVNTTCILTMPGGEERKLGSGNYSFKE